MFGLKLYISSSDSPKQLLPWVMIFLEVAENVLETQH